MKIAVFSDIHGNLKALKVVLKQIAEKKVDKVVFLGDIFQRGNEELECLDFIRENKIMCVKGNCAMSITCWCCTCSTDTGLVDWIWC